MKAVILGTGATIGTLGLEAGVIGFVRRLEAVRSNWRTEYPSLAQAVNDCGGNPLDVALDRLWTRLDYYSKFKTILGSAYPGEASTELRKALLDAYGFADEISRICSAQTTYPLKTVLADLGPGDAVISFNWDTLAETILHDVLRADLVQVPHPGSICRIRLVKPHGSLSWVHRSGEPIEIRDGANVRLKPMDVSDVYSGRPGSSEPLILGALPIKSELLDEIQRGEPGLHGLIASQWVEAVDAISRAEEIVVVGYRFPREDEYGRFLLREAVGKRAPLLAPPSLRYFSLGRDRNAFERAFRDVFGERVNYFYCGEVTSAFPKNQATG